MSYDAEATEQAIELHGYRVDHTHGLLHERVAALELTSKADRYDAIEARLAALEARQAATEEIVEEVAAEQETETTEEVVATSEEEPPTEPEPDIPPKRAHFLTRRVPKHE